MRKNKKRERIDEYRRYRFHLECVRRNDEYRKDYKEWEAEQDEYDKQDKEAAIFEKWNLRTVEPLPNPLERPPLKNVLKALPLGEVCLPQHERVDPLTWAALDTIRSIFSDSAMSDPTLLGLLVLGYRPEESPDKLHRIVLNLRWPKKTIMTALEEFVTRQLAERKKANLKQQEQSFKARLGEWVNFLRVYDERKGGKTFKQIADTFVATERLDKLQKAKECYQRGEQLVRSPPFLKIMFVQ